MANGKRCNGHNERDFTTEFRPGFGMLCAACFIDVRTSTVKAKPVQPREQHDRYAQMAERYGIR